MTERVFTYTVTYDVVTPESAEFGDTADNGFLDSHGVKFSLADKHTLADAQRGVFDQVGTADDIGDEWGYDGPFEPSDSLIDTGTWFTGASYENSVKGTSTRRAIHVKDASADELRDILAALNL